MRNRSYDLPGIALAGVTGGIAAASVNIAAHVAHQPSDILGFAGAALGAFAAVTGAVFVEYYKENRARKTRRSVLSGSLISMASVAVASLKLDEDLAAPALITTWQSIQTAQAAAAAMPADNFYVHGLLANLTYWGPRWQESIDEGLALRKANPSFVLLNDETKLMLKRMAGTAEFIVQDRDYWGSEAVMVAKGFAAEANLLTLNVQGVEMMRYEEPQVAGS